MHTHVPYTHTVLYMGEEEGRTDFGTWPTLQALAACCFVETSGQEPGGSGGILGSQNSLLSGHLSPPAAWTARRVI